MRRHRDTSRKPAKAQQALKAKRGAASKLARKSKDTEVARLARELAEARELQAASAAVLRVISNSPGDVQPVFDAIAESAVRLCEGQFSFVLRFDGELLHFGACHGLTPEWSQAFRRGLPRPADETTASGRAILHRAVAQIPDLRLDPVYRLVSVAHAVSTRSIVAVPMLRHGQAIGSVAVGRAEVGLFSAGQIALLETFADQAVIAIENARLLNELRQRTDDLTESLEQQTATSEVLRVISTSPGELTPVFEAMLANAMRICDAKFGHLLLYDGGYFRAARITRPTRADCKKLPSLARQGGYLGRHTVGSGNQNRGGAVGLLHSDYHAYSYCEFVLSF